MDKQTFVSQIKPVLKQRNYRKNGNYWYKQALSYVCCINIQGSQWSKDDYYVNIGFYLPDPGIKNPTILHWYCRHRCIGKSGELNILPDEFLKCIEDVFGSVSSASQISVFLTSRNAQKIVNQYWF